MKINSLKLTNFRNYSKLNLNFSGNLNIIYGKNGVGKTNLVEAIYLLSLTKSFRTRIDKNLIRHGEVSLKIEGEVETNSVDNYELIINKEGKKAKINGNVVSKMSDYITNINIVLLEPEEQMLFSASPQVRRMLLNVEISQLQKDYIKYLNSYNKVLKQRNFYLRELYVNGNASKDYLNILTNKLIDYGSKIYEYRKIFIEDINKYIGEKYLKAFGDGNLEIKYVSDYNEKNLEEREELYNKNYNREVIMGKTLTGIHHDDIIFLLDKRNIGEYASNGQQKNAIFAFKLAEIELIHEKKNIYPILILDDLFSALDNEKIGNIFKMLNKDIQTFITTTEVEKTRDLGDGKLFNITKDGIKEGI